MKTILKECQKIESEFIDLWRKLVNIDSGSGYSKGLRQVGEITGVFMENLGMKVTQYPANHRESEFNILGETKGDGDRSILLLAHLDTVFPEGTVAQRSFHIDSEWAYGPGVSDCKGGVVQALYATYILKKMGVAPYKCLTLLFNCDEEISSPSSKELIIKLAKQHDYVLSLEPGGINDGVVEWRKGTAKLHLEVQGKSSHSGSDPESGCNALLELAHQLTRLEHLGCKDKGTSVTFTKARGGERLNIVPDYADAWADVRVTSLEELDRIEKESLSLVAQSVIPGTIATISLDRQKPPFVPNPGTKGLVQKAKAIYAEIGRTLSSAGAGGASDANWAATAGRAIILDSLGPVKGGANHTPAEKTSLASLVPRLYLLVRMIMELGGGDVKTK